MCLFLFCISRWLKFTPGKKSSLEIFLFKQHHISEEGKVILSSFIPYRVVLRGHTVDGQPYFQSTSRKNAKGPVSIELFLIWLKSLRRFILGYFFVWEITSKGSQWKEGNLMGTCQSNSLENVVKTTGWSDQWGCKISFGICSHLLKSSGIGSVLRATHMVVGFIRRTFVLREGWTEEPQGRSESHLWLAWGI